MSVLGQVFHMFWVIVAIFDSILLMEEILHQLIGSLSHYLQGFSTIPGGCLGFLPSTNWNVQNLVNNNGINYQPQLVQDFWTINSSTIWTHYTPLPREKNAHHWHHDSQENGQSKLCFTHGFHQNHSLPIAAIFRARPQQKWHREQISQGFLNKV